jgi:hypothetical protein
MLSGNEYTNILSLKKNVRKKFHVTYDSQGEGAFIVHKPIGIDVHFTVHANGLHYHDTAATTVKQTPLSTLRNALLTLLAPSTEKVEISDPRSSTK